MPNLSKTKIEQQVSRYAQERPLYKAFSHKLRLLLESLLESEGIKYQVVESRAKDVKIFEEKITRSGKSYINPINELTDLCGARIIVYYQGDVDQVADLMAREFKVVEQESAHQVDSLDADRFGYLSFHLIVALGQTRSELSEWKFAADLKAEVQIRTVIQHAWSAVSHALQYKQETAIPSKLQRRLFRIAGLFELADAEFMGIRDAKDALAEAAAAQFSSGNKSIPITSESIAAMVKSSENVKKLNKMAEVAGFEVTEDDEDENAYPEIYDAAKRLKLTSVGEVENILAEESGEYFKSIFNGLQEKEWSIPPEFVVFFVLLRKAHTSYSTEQLQEYGWGGTISKAMLSSAKQFSLT